jgi:ATP synthase F1 delta subunit
MRVTAKQYAQTLYDLTDGKSNPEIEKSLADFARFLRKERKLKLSGKIIENFGKIYDRENSISSAEIVTAEKISAETEKKVKNYIGKKYSAKKVVLKDIIDPNIKGGMIIRVGDEVTDGSILGRLNELKKVLTK